MMPPVCVCACVLPECCRSLAQLTAAAALDVGEKLLRKGIHSLRNIIESR